MTEAEQATLDVHSTPVGFIEEVLGLPMYPWQDKAVSRLSLAGWGKPIVQISALAPNEAGKSSRIVAGSALYWATIKNGRVAITTKDQKQLNEQIIPAIEAQIHKLEGFKSVRSPYYKITDKTHDTRIIAYVTDDSDRVEGFHGRPDCPLLEIVDEAKSVEEKIFQGIDRCGYQAIILCSSGGLMQGTFYDSQTKHRASWHCVNAGLKDCPHISPDKVKRIIDKWGENHPFTRSCVYGEFMEQDDSVQYCVTHSALKRCLESPPRHHAGVEVGFVDFAEGTAEYAFYHRNGNKAWREDSFREGDKRAACARLVSSFRKSGLRQDQIWGDAADKEACDILADLGWSINRQNFGAKAKQEEIYQSWSAEAWIETGIAISKGEIIVPIEDEILQAQLTCRQKEFVGRGKLAVEDKADMRKRGIESPDRADGYCGCFNVYGVEPQGKSAFSIPDDWMNKFDTDRRHEQLEEMGAFAGN